MGIPVKFVFRGLARKTTACHCRFVGSRVVFLTRGIGSDDTNRTKRVEKLVAQTRWARTRGMTYEAPTLRACVGCDHRAWPVRCWPRRLSTNFPMEHA